MTAKMDTNQTAVVVVREPWDVGRELKALGMTRDGVIGIARSVAAARAEALPVDPWSAAGMMAYVWGVRGIRLMLLPELGWRISRHGNVEATVNDGLGIQLLFQNVDVACDGPEPQPISGKGAGTRNLVEQGRQGELFERAATPPGQMIGVVPTVWMLCVSTGDGRLRAEVSCPREFDGSWFAGFDRRIFVLNEALDPDFRSRTQGEPDDGTDEIEVRIAKK